MKGIETSDADEPSGTPLLCQTNPPDHILVVEDDIFFRRLNTQMLVRSGYEVDAAADGAAAWRELNTENYDLLVTDNDMPKMSGVELLKKLRAARMALPVIMATGSLPKEEFARRPWLQPAATLLKPYTGEEMLRTVKKVLREADSTTDGSQQLSMKDNQTSQAGEPAGAPRQRPTRSAHHILVVEEDLDLRRLYADALAGLGYYVDAAENGAEAWAALRTQRYELVITEHEIPTLTGIELAKMLRAARMDVPVVLAARRLPTHELTRNPTLRFAATLSKPFAIDDLLNTVKSVLGATNGAPEPIKPPPAWRSQPVADGLCP